MDLQLEPASYFRRETLRDGTQVCVRAIRSDDKERLATGFNRLSPESRRRRFFASVSTLTPPALRYFTELDFRNHVGLAVSVDEPPEERFVAVGRFIRANPDADHAEVAFTVADDYQARGAATLLLTHLAGIARTLGIRAFSAVVQADNRGMLEVFEQAGLPIKSKVEQGVVQLCVELGA